MSFLSDDFVRGCLICTALTFITSLGCKAPSADLSTSTRPDASTSTSASAEPSPSAGPSASDAHDASTVRDERPFSIATENEALAKVHALPEAHEPLLIGVMKSVTKRPRDLWIVSRPAPGCVEGAPACRWQVAAGLAGSDGYVDRNFYLDARSGALHVRFDEGWPESDVGAKPYAEWKSMVERGRRAWALVRALPEVKAVKNFGMQPHAPTPYECTASASTPCRFTFDVCDRVRTSPCEANMPDTLATFSVDDVTRLVTVEAPGLTAGEGPVSVERWRELARSMAASKRAVEGRSCAGGRLRPAVMVDVTRVGCAKGSASCAWAFDMYFEAKGGVAYRNVMTVDAASHEVTAASRKVGGEAGASWPLAAFCERVARGEELTLEQWLR